MNGPADAPRRAGAGIRADGTTEHAAVVVEQPERNPDHIGVTLAVRFLASGRRAGVDLDAATARLVATDLVAAAAAVAPKQQ